MLANWTGRLAEGQHTGAEHRRHRRAAVQLTQQRHAWNVFMTAVQRASGPEYA